MRMGSSGWFWKSGEAGEIGGGVERRFCSDSRRRARARLATCCRSVLLREVKLAVDWLLDSRPPDSRPSLLVLLSRWLLLVSVVWCVYRVGRLACYPKPREAGAGMVLALFDKLSANPVGLLERPDLFSETVEMVDGLPDGFLPVRPSDEVILPSM